MRNNSFQKRVFWSVTNTMRFGTVCWFFLIFIGAFNVRLHAQEISAASRLMAIKAATDSTTRQYPAEKIYLQFDKDTYTPGDTLWFKAYLFNAPTLSLSAKSGLLYVSVVTDSNVVIKKLRLPVENGLSWGNISLKNLHAGIYTIIAYTTWLQNFDQACFFRKQFTIADDAGSNWLANYTCSSSIKDGKEQARVKLLLTDIYKMPITGKSLELAVMKGKRRLYNQTIQPDEKGLLDVAFNLPGKPGDVRIVVKDDAGNRVNIPLNFNRPQDADVQFMPEGGDMVAGLTANIGFKAIGVDGRGINITGVIFNKNKQPVADFATRYLGIGSFKLPVTAGERYTAKVTLPGGGTREYPLPDVKSEGIVLNVSNTKGEDSVMISLAATDKFAREGASYLLVGKARGIICYGAVLNFKNGPSIRQKISKQLFPTGITHFMLLDARNQPLNERLVFINRHDNLQISISTDKIAYTTRDSVALHIKVTDALGNPVAGNFSLAVTDDAQVHTDSLRNENMITRVLLSSELKGYVEQPGYYLNTNDATSSAALDNLLLTQGWVSYDWPGQQNGTVYAAETEFAIKGKVLNAFNKPVKSTKVSMLSKSPLLAADVITDNYGHFMFHNLPVTDTLAYVLKTAKNFNVNIVMDDARPPVFTAFTGSATIPWYVNSDTSVFNNLKNNRIRQNLVNDLPGGAHALKEVKITAKKIVKGSQNLNGPGEADISFDEADMEKAGKQTWLSFLEQRVPGFKVGRINKPNVKFSLEEKSIDDVNAAMKISFRTSPPILSLQWYFVDGKPIMIIIDGISIGVALASPLLDKPDFEDIKNYLEAHNAEDIKGIEIISSGKYSANYFRRYVNDDWKGVLSPADFTFVELTTRSGKGPWVSNTPGQYLYKPLALSLPARFYKPRYMVNKSKATPDLRSTITWEPNITTGADGKTTVCFFTADKPSTYTLIMEGTNMDGGIGYKTQKIKILLGNPRP